MSVISFIIVNLILSLFNLIVIKKYMDIFFCFKKKNNFQYLLWIIYCMIQLYFLVEKGIQPQIILLINILFILSLCAVSYSGSWKKCMIFAMLLCSLWILIEKIIIFIFEEFGIRRTMTVADTIISELLMFLLSVVAERCMHKKSGRDIPLHYVVLVLLIPMGSIYFVDNVFLLSEHYEEYTNFAVISSLVLLLANYVIFGIYDWMLQEAETRERNRLYELQLELCTRQAEEQERYNMDIRRVRHDINNHLVILLEMVQKRDVENAEKLISGLLDKVTKRDIKEISHSGNMVIDSLINYKNSIACKEGISFTTNVFVPANLPFRAGDLAIVFGNLIENGMDACRELEEGERQMELYASYEKGMLIITVSNPYKGKRYKGEDGQFVTTKKDTVYHGLGILSVEQALESYHGELQVDASGGIFRATVLMYGKISNNGLI